MPNRALNDFSYALLAHFLCIPKTNICFCHLARTLTLSLSTLLFTFCIAGPAFQSERTERKKGKANERKNVAQQSPPHRELAGGRSLPAAQESQSQSQSQSRSQSQSQTQFQSLCHLRAEHQKCTASERAEETRLL